MHAHDVCTHSYVCMCAYVCVCVCVCVCAYISMHALVHMHTNACVLMHVYRCILKCMCSNAYGCIHREGAMRHQQTSRNRRNSSIMHAHVYIGKERCAIGNEVVDGPDDCAYKQ